MKKDRSILWIWAFSYIVILMIPTISGIVNYWVNEQTISEGIIENYRTRMESIEESVEHLVTMQEEFFSLSVIMLIAKGMK